LLEDMEVVLEDTEVVTDTDMDMDTTLSPTMPTTMPSKISIPMTKSKCPKYVTVTSLKINTHPILSIRVERSHF